MIAWHGFGHDHFFGPDGGLLGFFFGLLMMLLWAGFWIFVIVLVVRLLRRSSHEHGATPSALHVLEERYARGEISREEFAERRAVLLSRPPPDQSSTQPL